jgi:hypothetical protein
VSKTIFILGAGASREGGFPVMRDFARWHVPKWAQTIEGTRDGEKQTVEEVAWPGSSDGHNYQ